MIHFPFCISNFLSSLYCHNLAAVYTVIPLASAVVVLAGATPPKDGLCIVVASYL
jgi:hypothetical protein